MKYIKQKIFNYKGEIELQNNSEALPCHQEFMTDQ